MKHWILILFIFCLGLPLSAQFMLDTTTYFWFDNVQAIEDGESPTLENLYDWYDRPACLTMALNLEAGGFKLYGQLEAKSDLVAELQYNWFSNLPALVNGSVLIDPNLPQVGYIQYQNDNILASFGRRKIDWGTGPYTLSLSEVNPYFDHIYFDMHKAFAKNEVGYAYTVITSDTRATSNTQGTTYKTLAGHNFYYQTDKIILKLTDFNLVWDRVPDLQEISPLVIFHSLYQRDQNNSLSLSADWLVTPSLRFYTELLIDDFQISVESEDSNPGGMGAVLGGQVILIEDTGYDSPLNSADDHTIGTPAFDLVGGLTLNWEFMWTSQFLFNRDEKGGTFSLPIYYMWDYSPYAVTSYYNAAYGPDRFISHVDLDYQKKDLSVNLDLEYHIIGSYGIYDDYEAPFDNWLTLATPLSHLFKVDLKGEWEYNDNYVLFGDIQIDYMEEFEIQCGLGWGASFF